MSKPATAFAAGLLLLAPAAASAAVNLVPIATANQPTYITNNGDQRLFIVERAGRILIFNRTTSTFQPFPFLDLTGKVVDLSGERGMFSVAFHPDYATNGFFYVYYTNTVGDVTIERYHVTSDPNIADQNSAATLLDIPHPLNNHNGGQLQVGPDGFLYAGIGDGGGANDPNCFAQNGQSLFGKLLRLDVRQNLNQAPFYGIPSSNPFLAPNDPADQIRDEIWALGLRNPWRFSFDRSNGDLFIGDVGQNAVEEVDLHRAAAAAGQNFGWKVMEGNTCLSMDGCAAGTPICNSPSFMLPIHTYTHVTGDSSITGGYFYRGSAVADLVGRYVFGDYCTGSIRTLRETSPNVWTVQPLVSGAAFLTTFGQDSAGELYTAAGNTIYKLAATTSVPALPRASHAPLLLALALLALGAVLVTRLRRRNSIRR